MNKKVSLAFVLVMLVATLGSTSAVYAVDSFTPEHPLNRENTVYQETFEYSPLNTDCLRDHDFDALPDDEDSFYERVIYETDFELTGFLSAQSSIEDEFDYVHESYRGLNPPMTVYANPPSSAHCAGYSMTYISTIVNWVYYSDTLHRREITDYWKCDRPGCNGATSVTDSGSLLSHNFSSSDGGHVSGTTTHRMIQKCNSCTYTRNTPYYCAGNPCQVLYTTPVDTD